VLLNYNLFVIEESKSIKAGVTDISLYSNLSKLLGFSLGSYIYKVNIDEYLIVFIIIFVLFSSFKINNFKNETEKNSERLVFNKLKRNQKAGKSEARQKSDASRVKIAKDRYRGDVRKYAKAVTKKNLVVAGADLASEKAFERPDKKTSNKNNK